MRNLDNKKTAFFVGRLFEILLCSIYFVVVFAFRPLMISLAPSLMCFAIGWMSLFEFQASVAFEIACCAYWLASVVFPAVPYW